MSSSRALLAGALLSAALAAPASAAAADPGLLGHWPLDTVSNDTTPDVSGAGRTGTGVAGAFADGRFGPGLFLSSSARTGFDVEDPTRALEPTSVSVLAWVKRSTTPDGEEIIVAKSGDDCESNAYALGSSYSGGISFTVAAPAGSGIDLVSAEFPASAVWDGRWHAVAGVFNAATTSVSITLDGSVRSVADRTVSSIAYDAFSQRRLSVGHY
ncbi:MAG: LamG-like jellyroll fold domain-containing protein, partial [Solirubrobacteraceae bacterium]|nr:LamG-like jellyroll fold domain-containing protein [Solirubrobacteraceae bacterium]